MSVCMYVCAIYIYVESSRHLAEYGGPYTAIVMQTSYASEVYTYFRGRHSYALELLFAVFTRMTASDSNI